MKQMIINAAAMAMANIGYGIPPGMMARDGFRPAPKKRGGKRNGKKKRHVTTVAAYFKDNSQEAWKRAVKSNDQFSMRQIRVRAYGSRM